MNDSSIIDSLKKVIGGENISAAKFKNNDLELEINKNKIREAASFFKQRGYTHLITIVPVEEPGYIQLLYYLEKYGSLAVLKIKIPCDDLNADSLTDIFPAAENFEREARDFFGLNFKGLTSSRIILPDNWPDKPLMRKT
ncbi:MAG: NADH-quinone oxidoreductase subunit C [Candidatus Odinarchaeum yellowstonii]|uniref:NADH-quinone oxidoreductase subunit C n=1 Tax=Odinarchaeota yellowstonii (strain LCB_4) TaxID=1841599 RepID=A0AAF0D248_ODILC|nr:MAG: NADH-quinone oxidoreductase subunit C [Candidatus Odinarchaeum yellowstonii]